MKEFFNNDKGQAIAEMAVCMVAIMAVFLAVIFAFAIGSSNIDNLLICREEADNNAYSQVYSYESPARQILTWNEGNDERLFTNDDEPEFGANDDPELFRGELQTAEVDLVNNYGEGYVQDSFAADIANVSGIFLESADLTSGAYESDPYDNMDLEDLRGAFSTLFFSSDLIIENSVYMPILEVEDLE